MKKARIAVLVSGGGTNLQALIDAQNSGIIKSGELALVISNNSGAYALERATKARIPTAVVLKKECGSQDAFEEKIKTLLSENEIDFIVLAGFMSILSENFTKDFPERILNVHPSLIPSFCGVGMYGHYVHEAVLAYGAKISGATTHFVDEEVDHGGVIMQKSVPVLEGDTPETLAARVLTVEHEILPETVRLFCAGKLGVDGRHVHVL